MRRIPVIQHTNNFEAVMKAARRVSTPLIAARTFDPASAIQKTLTTLGSRTESTPTVQWDVMRGLRHLNEAGRRVLAQILDGRDPETIGPTDALSLAHRLPEDTILVLTNSHRFWNDPAVMQGIWNLRDTFKARGCTLLLLASPGARLPEELAQDVLVLDQPLATVAEHEYVLGEFFRQPGSRAGEQQQSAATRFEGVPEVPDSLHYRRIIPESMGVRQHQNRVLREPVRQGERIGWADRFRVPSVEDLGEDFPSRF